ncbi:MAG: hypothetical protein LLG20_18810 [Acidobacteriales bacterium]|nr:hypothetical protein [Terriglobales bacterium]
MAGWDLCRLRCYLYIADKTWGYGKEWDAISISQFCGGVDGAGDRGAGYSETPVKAAIKALWLDGFIRIIFRPIHEKKANLYALTHPDCVELQATENRQIERERRASMPPDVGKHRMPKAECKVRKVARWTATEG